MPTDRAISFIAFEVSESFPNLSAGKNNPSVRRLSEMFTLWLDDFGSGKATLTALYDGLFDYVKIDKRFTGSCLPIRDMTWSSTRC